MADLQFSVRRAGPFDSRAMAGLLQALVDRGGTTAIKGPVSAEYMAEWMGSDADRSAWFLAETQTGEVLGFQTIGPHPDLPQDVCDIATFTRLGHSGLGVGSALFNATGPVARRLGYRSINATIRAENEGGPIYYQSRGFEPVPNAIPLDPRVSMRFDLD